MSRNTITEYRLFEPIRQAWILTGVAFFSAVLSLVRIGASARMPRHSGTPMDWYPYVMEAITLAVMVYWIASSRVALERAFVALWLGAWAMTWFDYLYPVPVLYFVQVVRTLVWIWTFLLALRILVTIRRAGIATAKDLAGE